MGICPQHAAEGFLIRSVWKLLFPSFTWCSLNSHGVGQPSLTLTCLPLLPRRAASLGRQRGIPSLISQHTPENWEFLRLRGRASRIPPASVREAALEGTEVGSEGAFPWPASESRAGHSRESAGVVALPGGRRGGGKGPGAIPGTGWGRARSPAQTRAASERPGCPGPAECPRPARDGSGTPAWRDPAPAQGCIRGAPLAPRPPPCPSQPLPPALPPGCPSQPPPWHRGHPTPSDTCAPGAGRGAEPRDSGRCPRRPLPAPWRGEGVGAALTARDGDPPPRRAPTARALGPSAGRGAGQLPAVTAPQLKDGERGWRGRGCFHPAPKPLLCPLKRCAVSRRAGM